MIIRSQGFPGCSPCGGAPAVHEGGSATTRKARSWTRTSAHTGPLCRERGVRLQTQGPGGEAGSPGGEAPLLQSVFLRCSFGAHQTSTGHPGDAELFVPGLGRSQSGVQGDEGSDQQLPAFRIPWERGAGLLTHHGGPNCFPKDSRPERSLEGPREPAAKGETGIAPRGRKHQAPRPETPRGAPRGRPQARTCQDLGNSEANFLKKQKRKC